MLVHKSVAVSHGDGVGVGVKRSSVGKIDVRLVTFGTGANKQFTLRACCPDSTERARLPGGVTASAIELSLGELKSIPTHLGLLWGPGAGCEL